MCATYQRSVRFPRHQRSSHATRRNRPCGIVGASRFDRAGDRCAPCAGGSRRRSVGRGGRSAAAYGTGESVSAALTGRPRMRPRFVRTRGACGGSARQLCRMVSYGRQCGTSIGGNMAALACRRTLGKQSGYDRCGHLQQTDEGTASRWWCSRRRPNIICKRLSFCELVPDTGDRLRTRRR